MRLCGHLRRYKKIVKNTYIISDKDMAQMNYAVESEGKEPREVAETFLRNANLLK
ncbi:MAG: glycine betaine ABC transporter substrate-binding protein [Clostridiales bacterium]|nr:glycine betaine ABC transporter substrate-binding protein [Clostridiales bacterium]